MPRSQAQQDPRQQIRDEHPDAWIAIAEGDVIHGQVVDVQEAWSDVRQNGSWYPILTIAADEATGYDVPQGGTLELKVHGFGAVIYNELMRRRPTVGEVVRISFDGERPPRQKGFSPTKIYSVRVEGREQEGGDVYASIAREQPDSTVGRRRSQQPAGDVPADTSDFTPTGQDGAGKDDEDLPF